MFWHYHLKDELNAELEELEQEDLDERLLDVGEPSQLPSVPTEVPTKPSKIQTSILESLP